MKVFFFTEPNQSFHSVNHEADVKLKKPVSESERLLGLNDDAESVESPVRVEG